jgi:hypothetical protein
MFEQKYQTTLLKFLRLAKNCDLSKLSDSQFKDLSQDIFDEVERRNKSDAPYLTGNASYSSKRNQARQDLSNLQYKKLVELVENVYYEINCRIYNQIDPTKNNESFGDSHQNRRATPSYSGSPKTQSNRSSISRISSKSSMTGEINFPEEADPKNTKMEDLVAVF